MENPKKSCVRSTRKQIEFLNSYMAAHKDFAVGEYRTPLGASTNHRQWEQLKAALDELGPARSVDQWKLCWRDQRRKARGESAALEKAKNSTGNNVPLPELSGNAELVLSAIGREMAVGFGPAESPIGLTPASTTPLPALAPMTSSASGVQEPCTSDEQQPSTSGAQQPTQPPRATGAGRPTRRVRRVLPPDRFLNAQMEHNNIMKDLLKEIKRGVDEIKRGNDLIEARLQLLPPRQNEN